MKHSIIILALGALAFGAAMSSCSVVEKITNREPKSVTITKSGNKVKDVQIDSDKGKDKKGKGLTPPPSKALKKGTPNQPSVEELVGGKWTIVSVQSVTIDAEDDAPYVQFDINGRFYGSNGCNILNGNYVLRSDGVMVFSQVLSSLNLCPDNDYGYLINAVLSDESRPVVECQRIGQDTFLSFLDGKGKTVMTLKRNNMEFLNGNWQVTSIEGQRIDDPEANIFFDVAELKVHGNTGCNYFNGDLYFDPQRSNAIDLSNMMLTRMACPKTAQETAMMVALEEARTAIAGTEENTVLLTNAAGKQVMTLKRLPITLSTNDDEDE